METLEGAEQAVEDVVSREHLVGRVLQSVKNGGLKNPTREDHASKRRQVMDNGLCLSPNDTWPPRHVTDLDMTQAGVKTTSTDSLARL